MGGKGGDGGASAAAQAQRDAAQMNTDLQRDIFNQTRTDFTPYRDLGSQFLPQLTNYAQTNPDLAQARNYVSALGNLNPVINVDYSSIQNDPMYQFARDAALEQNARRASAMGLGNSSVRADWDANTAMQSALAARDRIYGQNIDNYARQYSALADQANFANQLGGQEYNRLMGLVNMGQAAAAQQAGAGQNYANNLTSINQNLANQLGQIEGQKQQYQQQQQQQLGGTLGTIGGGIGYAMGGPVGGFIGSAGGSLLGSIFG